MDPEVRTAQVDHSKSISERGPPQWPKSDIWSEVVAESMRIAQLTAGAQHDKYAFRGVACYLQELPGEKTEKEKHLNQTPRLSKALRVLRN